MADPRKKKGFLDKIMSEADETAHPLLQKIQEHQKLIILVLATIVVVAAVYSGYNFFQERAQQQALQEMNRIMAIQAERERLEALNDFLDRAPQTMRGGVLLEITRIHMDAGRYEQASSSFERLGEVDRTLRPVAVLGQAKALEFLEEYGRALEVLEEGEGEIPLEFTNQFNVQKAFVAEQAGEYTKALEAYENLLFEAQGIDDGFIQYKIENLRQKIED